MTSTKILLQERLKKSSTAYLFWFFLALFAAHRIYLNRNILVTILYIFTLGLFGFGYLIDLFLIQGWVNEHNRKILIELEAIEKQERLDLMQMASVNN